MEEWSGYKRLRTRWERRIIISKSARISLLTNGRICYISGSMKPLVKLGEATTDAEGHEWELWMRDGELSLMQDGASVASTRPCASEVGMAQLAVSPIARANKPLIMIAGLGLGGSVAAAMAALPRAKARFLIAEPVEQVVRWNREFSPRKEVLDDERVTVENEGAADLCRKRHGSLHAIILRHTHARCDMSLADAQAYFQALKGGSMLTILLARPDNKLNGTLKRAGFEISVSALPITDKGKQTRMHTLVLARRGRFVPFAER